MAQRPKFVRHSASEMLPNHAFPHCNVSGSYVKAAAWGPSIAVKTTSSHQLKKSHCPRSGTSEGRPFFIYISSVDYGSIVGPYIVTCTPKIRKPSRKRTGCDRVRLRRQDNGAARAVHRISEHREARDTQGVFATILQERQMSSDSTLSINSRQT